MERDTLLQSLFQVSFSVSGKEHSLHVPFTELTQRERERERDTPPPDPLSTISEIPR
jgi:hypothetical protein